MERQRVLWTLCMFIAAALPVLISAASALADASAADAFTCQGRMAQASEPVAGAVDFTSMLFDAQSGGEQVGPTFGAAGFAAFDAIGMFNALNGSFAGNGVTLNAVTRTCSTARSPGTARAFSIST